MVDVEALLGPGGGVPVGEGPAQRGAGDARIDAGEDLPALGEQTEFADPRPGEREQGQAQLAGAGGWVAGAAGGATGQVSQVRLGTGQRGGEQPPGGQAVADQQAGQPRGDGDATLLQLPVMALPAQEEPLDRPAGGIVGAAGGGGAQGGDQQPGLVLP